jgi:hypothetical protein
MVKGGDFSSAEANPGQPGCNRGREISQRLTHTSKQSLVWCGGGLQTPSRFPPPRKVVSGMAVVSTTNPPAEGGIGLDVVTFLVMFLDGRDTWSRSCPSPDGWGVFFFFLPHPRRGRVPIMFGRRRHGGGCFARCIHALTRTMSRNPRSCTWSHHSQDERVRRCG